MHLRHALVIVAAFLLNLAPASADTPQSPPSPPPNAFRMALGIGLPGLIEDGTLRPGTPSFGVGLSILNSFSKRWSWVTEIGAASAFNETRWVLQAGAGPGFKLSERVVLIFGSTLQVNPPNEKKVLDWNYVFGGATGLAIKQGSWGSVQASIGFGCALDGKCSIGIKFKVNFDLFRW